MVALKIECAGASTSTPPRQEPFQAVLYLVMPPTVIIPAMSRPRIAGKRSIMPDDPHPPSMLFAATTKRKRFPFGSGLPAASTPPIMSVIFFSTDAYVTIPGEDLLVALRVSSTQPLMLMIAVRKFGEAGCH